MYVFVLEECPITRKYAPELKRIQTDYERRGVTFAMVHLDPSADAKSSAAFKKEFAFTMTQILDTKHELARKAGVKNVPSAVLYMGEKPVYVGRIDDRFPQLGVERRAPTRKDLRIALDEVLAGKPVSMPRTSAVGCALPTL